MFIIKWINTLDLINIPPGHPLETITKVSTTDRNIIRHLTIQINNITIGITSTRSNTADPRTNNNSTMVPHLQGFQLYHLMMMIYCLQVCQHERKGYTFNLYKPQYTITTGTKYYTWLMPQYTYNLVTHIFSATYTGTSNSQAPNTYSETIS